MSLRDGIQGLLEVLDKAFTLIHVRRGKRRGNNSGDNLRTAVVQAGVVSGWTFFTTLASLRLVLTSKPLDCLVAACVNAGLMFFTVLMIKMGLLNIAEEAERISNGSD